jgi:ATP-dependent Clp protease ATP-binding subunit ClpA
MDMLRVKQSLDPTRTGHEAARLKSGLRARIVGQDEAIQQVVEAFQEFLAGMSAPGRPVGNFLFLGPTGTGKTRLVESLAETLLGDAHAVIKVDCAEFQHSHEIAKLVGSPPGYLGHKETKPYLSQETLDRGQTEKVKLSIVLFDEIEKASDALWNLLLGVLDKATLTLGDNTRVDFSRAMIFLTSNLGAAEMNNILRPNLGFAASQAERQLASGAPDERLSAKVARAGTEAARRKFTPEFMNRIDKVVVFRPLGEPELRQILTLELNAVKERILESGTPFVCSISSAAKDFLLREGTDAKYGARHLKRTVERELVHPLANLIASEQARGGDWIRVDFDVESRMLSFTREADGLPMAALAQLTDNSVEVPEMALAAEAVAAPARMSPPATHSKSKGK